MATNNAINLKNSGICSYDGAGTFTALANPLIVANGGTGVNSTIAYAPVVGGTTSTGNLQSVSVGSTGQVLQSQGNAAIPAYSTATFPSTATGTGKILRADGTNWVATTATYPNTAGTSGKVLISDGTNIVSSTPTFPNASATSRKIIVSDGTNWTASTETYAVPGTSGNVLTSDGTNWTSATAPGGGVLTSTTVITSLQVKAIRATPITLVAAPGVGKFIFVIACAAKLTYGGSNVFTSASGTILPYYNNSSGVALPVLLNNTQLVASSNRTSFATSLSTTTGASSSYENLPIVASNSSATEVTGNAANDNTITFAITYVILTL